MASIRGKSIGRITGYGLCTTLAGKANTGKIPVKWLCLLAIWQPCQPHFNPRSEPKAMKAAILVFPGINRERDMARALRLISGHEPAMVWHAETSLPAGTDLVVVPGGFSYGDY
jgi:hypothetical protein